VSTVPSGSTAASSPGPTGTAPAMPAVIQTMNSPFGETHQALSTRAGWPKRVAPARRALHG
jgi:hypothetical protein